MTLRILDSINYGYDAIEPVIVGLVALNKSFMLIGRHGTGKTRMARALSQGYGEHGFVFYDATKDDLISIAGIPDPESLKKGRLRFVPHERSIWDKSTVVVDEITRAGKESQNLWLEILEERTCFGLPLAYRTLIATANPESYAAAFQLDEALLDRFHAVIPVPEHQQGTSAEDVLKMVELAAPGVPGRAGPEAASLARVFAEIQKAHQSLLDEGASQRIAQYLGKLVPSILGLLKEQSGPYLSARTYARNFPETLLAVAAYYRVAGVQDVLRKAAIDALRYAVSTKLQVRPAMLDPFHQAAAALLESKSVAPSEAIRLEISSPASFEKRLEYLTGNWAAIKDALAPDEIEKILGELLRGASQKGEQEKLVELRHALERLGYKGDALRQVDGRLLIALNGAVSAVTPRLKNLLDGRPNGAEKEKASLNIERFRAMVSAGTFLGNASPEVRRLQKYLIDLREGDVPGDDDSLYKMIAGLELPEIGSSASRPADAAKS
jgi:MoxR-like ATPase